MKIIVDNNENNKIEKAYTIDYYPENKKGLSSDIVYISINKNLCLKVYSDSKYSKNSYKMELKNLKLLSNYEHFPKYIGCQKSKILMEYCGEKISKDNIPDDFINQIDDIINIFRSFSISHNDIHPDNILVKNGKIILIDFAFMDYINKSICHLIPSGMKDNVINNMSDINIRLEAERKCFILSIECIKNGKNYWDYIYINLNNLSLNSIRSSIKEYYYEKINKFNLNFHNQN